MTQISSTMYLPELGIEDPTLFHQYPMDSFGFQLQDLDFESFSASPKSSSSHKHFITQNSETTQNSSLTQSPQQSVAPPRPTKQPKTTMSSWSAYGSDMVAPKASSSSSSKIISFENSNASSVSSQQFYNLDAAKVKKSKIETGYGENLNFAAVVSQGAYDNNSFLDYDKQEKAATTTNRNPTQAQDHVLAERKRREKLSQRFIALSAIVPGLKKMDKATVLEDAIKYVKQLQERVKTLEEQAVDKTVESAVFVKRSVVFAGEISDQSLPEIEARISGKVVLIRIHCNKHSGRAAAILRDLEKHHLTVQSSSFLPFGNNTLDITIVAQMNKDYCLTAKDLIKSLSQRLREL